MEEQPLPKRIDGDGNDRELNSVQPGASTAIDDTSESQVNLLSTAQQANS